MRYGASGPEPGETEGEGFGLRSKQNFMTQEEQNYLIIKGAIADLPEAERFEVQECYAALKDMLERHPLAGLAIALIGAELSK